MDCIFRNEKKKKRLLNSGILYVLFIVVLTSVLHNKPSAKKTFTKRRHNKIRAKRYLCIEMGNEFFH